MLPNVGHSLALKLTKGEEVIARAQNSAVNEPHAVQIMSQDLPHLNRKQAKKVVEELGKRAADGSGGQAKQSDVLATLIQQIHTFPSAAQPRVMAMIASETMKLPPEHAAEPLRALSQQLYFMGQGQKLKAVFGEALDREPNVATRMEYMKNLTAGSSQMASPARSQMVVMLAGQLEKLPNIQNEGGLPKAFLFGDVLTVAKENLNPADMKPAMSALVNSIHCCPPGFVPTAMCALVLQQPDRRLSGADRIDVMVQLANTIGSGDFNPDLSNTMFETLLGLQEDHAMHDIPNGQRLPLLDALSKQLVHLPPDEQCKTALSLLAQSENIHGSPDRSALLNQVQQFAEQHDLGRGEHEGQAYSKSDLLKFNVLAYKDADLASGRTPRQN